jgi:small subunit ribosomal protein S16
MLRIRFLRVGKKNSPSFRIVVTPRRSAAKTGRFLEVLGFYNPIRHERGLKRERIQHWLSQGAQPSDSMRNMLVSEGIMEGKKTPVHKKSKKKEEEAVPEAPKAETKTDSAEVPASSEGGEAPEKAAEEGGESTTPASEPVVEEAEKKEDSPGESEETAAVEDKKV